MNNKKDNLVWIDLEMTGLEPDVDHIIEIASIITDKDLNTIAEGPNLVIHVSDEILDQMDDWNKTHHGQSGLIDKIKKSTYSLEQAEAETLEFIKQYTEEKANPLCGNSIGQDRRFLYPYMPKLSEWLHYRSIDVSTIKELSNRWYQVKQFKKSDKHEALADIRESIAELQHYREEVFK